MMRPWAPLLLLPSVALWPGCHCKGHDAPATTSTSAGTRRPPELHPEIHPASPASLRADIAALEAIHAQLGEPEPGDWLAEHEEPGQSFEEYLQSSPVTPEPDGGRRVVYVQPLGALDETQQRIVTLAADYLERFFGLPVRSEAPLDLAIIPEQARRRHPQWGVPQILSSFVLDSVLRPRLPDDAAAYISFTASDLWPGEGWNFVFGQASLRDRVGVWSMYRTGDPHGGTDDLHRALWRTLKTAVHETAHMFSIEHCTAYECVMNGSNSLAESDARPMWLCPECMAKVAWATGQDPVSRYLRLTEFAKTHRFAKETAFFERAIDALAHRHDHD